MKKLKFLFLTLAALSALSCAKSEPPAPAATPVEYAKACDPANAGKTVAVQGFLNAGNNTPCLKFFRVVKNGASVRECAFKFLDKVNVVGDEILVYVPEGKGRSEVETPDAGNENARPTGVFPRENLKLRLEDGTEVVPQESIATPVTVTGELKLTDRSSVPGDGKICSIHASKVEKR